MTAVRAYRPEDAEALSRLYVASVRGLGARDYSAAQIDAWAGLAPSAERLQALMADGRVRRVVVDDLGRPLAFGDLQADGLIHFLYCSPEAAGTGVAAALYTAIEAEARASGMMRLTAEASEAAVRFLSKQGFSVLERRDFEVGGVAIHNYAVEKRL